MREWGGGGVPHKTLRIQMEEALNFGRQNEITYVLVWFTAARMGLPVRPVGIVELHAQLLNLALKLSHGLLLVINL